MAAVCEEPHGCGLTSLQRDRRVHSKPRADDPPGSHRTRADEAALGSLRLTRSCSKTVATFATAWASQRETRTKPAMLVATHCGDIRVRLRVGITEFGCTLPNTGSRSDFFSTKMIDAPHVSWQSNRLTGLSSRQCRTELGCMRLT